MSIHGYFINIGNIMVNIKQHYVKYKRKQLRNQVRQELKRLEEIHTSNLTWSASLKVNIELLQILKAELLSVSGSDYSSIYLNTGFRNVVHLFDWTNTVIETLKARKPISFEMTNLTYQRTPIRLSEFLLSAKSRRYPIDALYINLSAELNTIMHHFNEIKDPMYADRSTAALDEIWVDVFAIVEMLCTLGVSDEQ